MNWGTKKTFLKVQEVVESGDQRGYKEIMDIISDDVIAHVKLRVPESYQDDVMQEICLSVFIHLVDYLTKFETLSAKERNAWLSKIATNKINDYWREHYRYYTMKDQLTNATRRVVFTFGELTPEATDDDEEPEYEVKFIDCELDAVSSISSRDFPLEAIRFVCSSKASPDRILAFLYQKYLFVQNKNAKPTRTVEMLGNYTLGELYSIFLNTLTYNREVRSHLAHALQALYAALNQKTEKDEYVFQQLFALTPKQVTDSYYNINKNLNNKFKS